MTLIGIGSLWKIENSIHTPICEWANTTKTRNPLPSHTSQPQASYYLGQIQF
jgi:hypothetical protein